MFAFEVSLLLTMCHLCLIAEQESFKRNPHGGNHLEMECGNGLVCQYVEEECQPMTTLIPSAGTMHI